MLLKEVANEGSPGCGMVEGGGKGVVIIGRWVGRDGWWVGQEVKEGDSERNWVTDE